MVRLRQLTLFLFIVLTACQRPTSDFSSLRIEVPKARNPLNKSGSVGSMAAMPSDRKACYGVSVRDGGLESTAPTCGPVTGLRAGFVEPGQVIAMEISKGSGRTIELYALLQAVGENLPCPQFVASLSTKQVVSTYLIGSVANVDMQGEETVVTITADFPGVANNIAAQLSLPAQCTAVGESQPAVISSGRSVASGGGMRLIGIVGKSVRDGQATGGGIKLITQ